MSRLELFVAADCPSCVHAQRVAHRAAARFPELDVTITDLDHPDAVVPDAVFAVPTFCLDDRVISLGTPAWGTLAKTIQAHLAKPNSHGTTHILQPPATNDKRPILTRCA